MNEGQKGRESGRRALGAVALLALGLVGAAAPALPAKAADAADELGARLEAYLAQPRFHGAAWGVKVVSLDTGRTLFAHDADRLLSAASTSKLYVAALALDRLGGDYRIVTPILATARPDGAGRLQGDVIVWGRGDPSWSARRGGGSFEDVFEPFAAALLRAGVSHITGDLVADATWFQSPPVGAGWAAADLGYGYGAEISAVTLEDNYAELRVAPAADAGRPCALTLLPPHTGLVLDNRTVTTAPDGGRQIEARRVLEENTVRVFGEWPVDAAEAVVPVAVPRPAQWFAAALKAALARHGIRVDGAARSVRWPEPPAAGPACVRLGEVASPPLRELVAACLKRSQNLAAALLFAHLGELARPADAPAWRTSGECAAAALQEFLRRHGLPADEVQLEEGAGLSPDNLATAQATTALLQFMAARRDAGDFVGALPVAGVDGTLRRRMQGTAAEGNVRAKTGSLHWAHVLAGYVTSAAGERLAFCVMLNRAVAPPDRDVGAELDAIAVLLAEFPGRAGAPSPGSAP
jgi:D-alanyl-D-alanine carboxypeptidase/D-alanyl-D-alanine-endopeptidase (penicillin-binding protein 4)